MELPRPDDGEPFAPEAIPELDEEISLPITAEEVSPLAEKLTKFEGARSDILNIIAENFADSAGIEARQSAFISAKVAYLNAYTTLLAEIVTAYGDDIDDLVQATTNLTCEDIDARYQTFSLLADRFDTSDKPTRVNVEASHDGEADEHLRDEDERSPAAFINCLSEYFHVDVEESLQAIDDLLPEAPDEEELPLRAKLLRGIGKAASNAATIAAGVAAGIIIADRLKRR